MLTRCIERGCLFLTASCLALAAGGCAADREPPAMQGPRLSPADFASAGADSSQTASSPRPSPSPSRAIDANAARGGVGPVVVLTGPPVAPSSVPPSTGEQRLQVDQLVGQINGRPIYADEFFNPMDDRLRREAERMSARDWLAFVRKEVESALWDKLRDELLLAEFETGLSPEQRRGLLAFVEDVRRDLISGNFGSESLANQRLREVEGLGLEEKVKDVTQREFIAFQLRKSIASRVSVSAKDIQRYYEQHQDEFIPPPVARFIVLRLPRSDEPAIEEAQRALASGEPFESIAARLSTWRPEQGNAAEVEFKADAFAEGTYFGPSALNESARRLAVGQVSERIDVGPDAYWLFLAAIDRKPGRSLYDAQREIEQKIRAQRVREEEVRYFEQLFRRGSFSDVKQMTRRLVEFAAERYLIHRRTPRDE